MSWTRSSLPLLAVFVGAALALQAPAVTGQAVGTDPNNPNAPDRYEVTITLHPGDPRIHDFHLFWDSVDGKPDQPKWSGPDGTWNTNVYDNVPAPAGSGVTGGADVVSFTSSSGAAASDNPVTLTFTFKPYGGTNQTPRTVYWYATTDGSTGLPGAGTADPDVEGWGFVTQLGAWNFPTH